MNCHEKSRGHGYQAMDGRMVCGDCEAEMPARVELVAALPVVRRPAIPAPRMCIVCHTALSSRAAEEQRVVCWRPSCERRYGNALKRVVGAGGAVAELAKALTPAASYGLRGVA